MTKLIYDIRPPNKKLKVMINRIKPIKMPLTRFIKAPKYFITGNKKDKELVNQLHIIDYNPTK